MGNVGHEFTSPGLGLGDVVRHGVEGLGQLPHLVAAAAAAHPGLILPVPELPHGLRHILEGPGHPEGGDGTGDKGHQHDYNGGKEEDVGKGPPHLGDAAGLGGDKDQSHHLLAALDGQQHRGPRHIPFFGKDPLQVAHGPKGAGGVDGLHHAARDVLSHHAALLPGAVPGIDDLSVLHGEENGGVRHLRHSLHRGPEEGGLHGKAAQLLAAGDGLSGYPGDVVGVVPQGILAFADGVAVREGDKGRAQQRKRHQDHARHDGELPLIETFQREVPLSRPGCYWGSMTSNLYPTPHTVLRLHCSETPSSFSRRRLMCTSTVRESPK